MGDQPGTCSTCPFSHPRKLIGPDVVECRRYPPVFIVDLTAPVLGDGPMVGWPQVLPDHWCGEHPTRAHQGPDTVPGVPGDPGRAAGPQEATTAV